MRLKALLAKQAANLARVKEIEAAAGDNPFSDEQRAEMTKLRAESSQLATDITDARATIEQERALAATVPAGTDASTVESARARAATGVEIGADPLDKQEKANAPGFFGRQLQAVRKAALVLKGGDEPLSADERAMLKKMAGPTGLNTDVPSEGGFLVGQERTSTILQRAYSQGQVLSRVGRIPISAGSNGIKLPAIDETSRADNSRFGGIVSGWLGQGNDLAAGKPKFREMDLKLRKVGAFVYSTDELQADAIALEAWINRNLPLELTFRTEDAVVNGTGGIQPQGIMNSGAVITVTRSAASRVQSADMKGMWNRMWAPARMNAVWLIDQSIEGELDELAVAIGTGGVLDPAYKPAGSMPGQVFATYKGRPIIPVEYCAALGTSGDIVLAALDEYTLIDKGGVESAVSLHVAFLTDQAVYRFIYRVDGQLNWNAPLTPKSAGSTLSCAVRLS